MMHIMVPLDGSVSAERAILPALQLLERASTPRELTLLHVIPQPPSSSVNISASPDQATLKRASKDYLSIVRQRHRAPHITMTTHFESGAPVAVICRQARRHHVDLIVLTHHEVSALQRLEHLSIAESVARAAPTSTLIVREDGETFPAFCHYVPLTLLVPLNGSSQDVADLAPAVDLARACDGAIRLLYIMPPTTGEFDVDQVADEQAHLSLSIIHDSLQRQGIMTYRSLAWGRPADAILTTMQQHPIDLIVLTDGSYSGISRLFDRNLSESFLQQMRLPVLVVCPPTTSAPLLTPMSTARSAP